MKIDLTPEAGFPLLLEPCTLEVTIPEELHFSRETRRLSEMQPVLHEPDALPAETVLYWNFTLRDAGRFETICKEMRLTFGLVFLPPMKIGKEYVKTHGHYHSAIPGSQIGFPEVYTHYYGQLNLYMQRRRGRSLSHLDDCVFYRMKPGHSIMIPPGYAHILVNPSSSPALMGGLYSLDAVHDYGPILEMAGGAYYFVEDAGQERALLNPRYDACPPLREIEELAGTRFAPPDDRRPLWSSFTEDPQRYAFITNASKAGLQFLPEDHSR